LNYSKVAVGASAANGKNACAAVIANPANERPVLGKVSTY